MYQVTTICLLAGHSYFKGLRMGVKEKEAGEEH